MENCSDGPTDSLGLVQPFEQVALRLQGKRGLWGRRWDVVQFWFDGVLAGHFDACDPSEDSFWRYDPMSVDKYAVCPCGSGKKIKFCKCKDSVSELDGVLKMVEGGQIVPALDRLSSILDQHPDAAWALAIRGRLLLDLREYDSLSDNADRFIRLQPSNPLALTQRAAARLFHGEVEQATESMLAALTESGREVDSFVLDVASILAFSLAQRGIFLTARVYASLSMMASGYEGGQAAISVLRQLNTSPTINQLIKSTPATIERPSDAEWGERYDEAATLLHSNKIDLAEAKFQSLRRTLPNEPAVLSGLLSCAVWRGDVGTQSELLRKLSGCETLDDEQRVRFRALSALVDPESSEISIPVAILESPLDNVEEAELSLMSDARFVALPSNLLGSMRMTDEDVPPRSGFQIIDRDKPESLDSLPPIDDVPEAIALAFIYGKQTDREARLEVHDVQASDVGEVRAKLEALIPNLKLEESSGDALPLLAACQPQIAMIHYKAKPADAEKLQAELMKARMADAIASTEIPLLGGKSLKSTADDESMKFDRTVVMRIIEQYDAIASKGDEIIAELYSLAKLEPLPMIRPENGAVESIANEDLNRVDPSGLDAESLIYLLQRAQQVTSTPAMRRFATKLVGMDLDQEQRPAKMLAYMTLINAAAQNDEALKLLEEAKAYAESMQMPIANLLLSEVGLRLSAGDAAGFQNAIETLTSRYGNEPEVMARLQQMLMSYGLISPDGTPRGGQQPATANASPTQGGELWTPEQGSPPEQQAGNKLWIPGMD